MSDKDQRHFDYIKDELIIDDDQSLDSNVAKGDAFTGYFTKKILNTAIISKKRF